MKRVCAKPGCNTILSRYNADLHCAQHEGQTLDTSDYLESLASVTVLTKPPTKDTPWPPRVRRATRQR